MGNTSVGLRKKSSKVATRHGSSPPPSVPAVARPSILIDAEFLKDGEKNLLVLFALFKSLLENTYSRDVVRLAVFGSVRLLDGVVDKAEARQIADKLILMANRRPSPMDGMF